MNIQDIADDTARAGDQLIDAAYALQDQGRALRDLSQDIRYEQAEPTVLRRAIIDLEVAIRHATRLAEDAAAMLRRLPYEGPVTYG